MLRQARGGSHRPNSIGRATIRMPQDSLTDLTLRSSTSSERSMLLPHTILFITRMELSRELIQLETSFSLPAAKSLATARKTTSARARFLRITTERKMSIKSSTTLQRHQPLDIGGSALRTRGSRTPCASSTPTGHLATSLRAMASARSQLA